VPAATQSTGPLYNKIRDELGKGLDLLTIGKKFFVDLAERIAKELNISNCWVCVRTHMRDSSLMWALERDQFKPTFIVEPIYN
jgi:hypothetical protein